MSAKEGTKTTLFRTPSKTPKTRTHIGLRTQALCANSNIYSSTKTIDNGKMNKKGTFVCLDLETTGISTKTAEIVELAAICFSWEPGSDSPKLFGSFQSLVKPLGENHAAAVRVHGITDAMLQDEQTLDKVFVDFETWLKTVAVEDFVFCGHNIRRFDLPILKRLAPVPILERPLFDTLEVARVVYKTASSKKLSSLYQTVCKPIPGKIAAHRALDDVRMNVQLCVAEMKRIHKAGVLVERFLK